jgi:high-affinity Fe2+/Pb2+ permease
MQIMINLLQKTNMPQFRKYVWYGVFSGLAVACVVGTGFVAAYYVAQNAVMTDSARAIFSGVFSLVAAIFLTVLGLQFLRFKDIQDKYTRKLSLGIQKAKDEVRSHSLIVN